MAPSPYRVAVGILLRFYVSGRPFEALAVERGPFTDQICTALGALAEAEADRSVSIPLSRVTLQAGATCVRGRVMRGVFLALLLAADR